MYPNSSPFGTRPTLASQYSRIGLESDVIGASPHRLIVLLFDGLFDAMNLAQAAIAAGDVQAKTRALNKAVRIIDEGLNAALNLDAGPIAQDLRALYDFASRRLMHANLHSDTAAIEDCRRALSPIREAWNAIGTSPAAQPPALDRAA